MTLESTNTKAVYIANGVQTSYPVPFPVFEAADLEALSVSPLGEETYLTDFTVRGLGSSSGVYLEFAAPPALGLSLVIRRATAPVQKSAYPEGGKFPSATVERDFDRIVGMIQEILEKVGRAILISSAADENPPTAEEFFGRIDQIIEDGKAEIRAVVAAAEDEFQAILLAAEEQLNGIRDEAKAQADRAEQLVDPVALASGIYNVRKAFTLDADLAAGEILELPGYYFPTRDVLFLAYEGVVCSPRKAFSEVGGQYQYEEVGTDRNVPSNQVRLWFAARAGELFDLWVITSAQGQNVDEIAELIERGEAAAVDAEDSAALAVTAENAAEEAAERAMAAAATVPDVREATPGQVVTARLKDGRMTAQYEDPAGGGARRGTVALAAALPAGTPLTVPEYIVGDARLKVFMDGVLCEGGASSGAATYREEGGQGAASTSITFFETLGAGTVITAVVG